MRGAVYLAVVCVAYLFMNYQTNQLALYHKFDVVFFYSPYAWVFVHIISYMAIAACVYSRPDLDLLLRRLALGVSLKAITQYVTIVPQPDIVGGVEACRDVPWWSLQGCADMMFSGHTMVTMLLLYKYKYRGFAVFAMAFELVFAKWHYISDCIMAVLAATAVESWIPLRTITI